MAVLSEEQELLKDAAHAWAQERSPLTVLRRVRREREPAGYDRKLYREMAEMGWAGIVVPAEYGGAEFGYFSMGVVLEQLGRTLTASPLIPSALAAATGLNLAGSAAQKQEWLPKIANGEAVIALAIDDTSRHAPDQIGMRAEKHGAGFKLTGAKRPVANGMTADAAIVAAQTPRGLSLFLVRTDAAGLTRQSLNEIENRGAAIYHFDGVSVAAADVLGKVGEGAPLLERILDCARAGLAAEMLGAANAAFEITLAYLKTRVQFGRLIGEFQALQHRAADISGELELARSAVEAALTALDGESPERAELVSLAKAMAGEAFLRTAREMIQMHGGIGMTDEHDAGLFLKRARIADMSFGTAAFHRERYAMLLGY